MKRAIIAVIGLALCVQAAVFEADIQHGGVSMGTVTATQGEDGFYAFSAEWSPNYSVDWAYWEERMPGGGTQLQAWDIGESPAEWDSPWWVVPGDIMGQTCWLVDSTHNLAYAPRGIFERVDVITPEPVGFMIFGMLGLAVAFSRRNRLLPVLLLLFITASPALYAADMTADAIKEVQSVVKDRTEPFGYTVTITVSPVTAPKPGQVAASMTKVEVTQWVQKRTLRNNVQVGSVETVSLGTRDVTATLKAMGIVSLDLTPGKCTWAKDAWEKGAPSEDEK